MFGFVKPYIPELKVKEHEFYRASYCGLCREMKRATSRVSSYTLSYDMVFFALVRLALTGEDFTVTRSRCAVHPFKKRPFISHTVAFEYTAHVNASLVYHKLKDDISDERGFARIGAECALPYAKHMVVKAGKPDIGKLAEAKLAELASLEKSGCGMLDMCAEVFGELLSLLLSYGLEGKEKLIASEIGRLTGRVIYIMDAICDIDEDIKKRRYNPISASGMTEDSIRQAEDDAFIGLTELSRAADLIDYGDKQYLYNCIKNIVDYGVVNQYRQRREKTAKKPKPGKEL